MCKKKDGMEQNGSFATSRNINQVSLQTWMVKDDIRESSKLFETELEKEPFPRKRISPSNSDGGGSSCTLTCV